MPNADPAEGFILRPLHFEIDEVASLFNHDLEPVDGLFAGTALFDLHQDAGLVPGLDLDRPVEGGDSNIRRALDGEPLLFPHDLAVRIDCHDAAGRGEKTQAEGQHRDEGPVLHTPIDGAPAI